MTATPVSLRGIGLLAVLLLWGIGGQAVAQSTGSEPASINVQGVPLGQALEQAAASAGISLVYDFALVEGHRASCTARNVAPAALLRCLLEEHPIDYVRTSEGTYVLQTAVRRPPRRGQLTGSVRGGKSGRPLVGAHVRLPDAQQFAGAVTDSAGRFRLTGLVPGPHTVVISRLGYARHEATVRVPPGGAARHEATLAPAPIVADSVVIDADRYGSSSAQGGEDRVSAAQLRQPVGAGPPDVLDRASTLLGLTTSAPYANLHIQGGDAGDHRFYLDGVPVRNPTSAGQLLGAFSPLALDGLTARKAGFGVLGGNALSGTIHLRHDLSGRKSRYGTVRVTPRSVEGRFRGTASLGTVPVTVMMAARTSVWDVYQEAGLHDLIDRWSTLDPVLAAARTPADTSLAGGHLGARAQPSAGFYDLHGAARFDLGPAEEVYVSAYHGGSHLGADLVLGRNVGGRFSAAAGTEASLGGVVDTSAFALPTHDEFSWANTAAQARYEAPVTSRTTGTLQASVSHYRGETQSEVGPLRQDSPSDDYTSTVAAARRAAYKQEGMNSISEVDLEGRLDVAFSTRGGLALTATATYQSSRFRIGNAFAPRLRHRGKSVRLATAAETTVGIGPHATLEGGIRLTGLPSQARLFAEPRGRFRYNRSLGALGTVGLQVKGGLYRQFTTQFELRRDGATAVVPTTHVWLPVSSSMTPSRVYHFAADLTWRPGAHWQVDLEGYRKWQPHLLAVDYPALRNTPSRLGDTPGASRILGSSQGDAYGGGLHVTYDGPSLMGALRYEYSRAHRTFPGRFDGRSTPVPWVKPHHLTLSAEVPLGEGVALEAQGEGVWGRTWGYRRAYYAYLTPADLEEAWDRIRLDRPGTHVLSPLYRLDTGLSMTQSWGGVEVKGRIGIANVLDRRNTADWALEPHRNGTVSRWARTLPGRRATISVRIRY